MTVDGVLWHLVAVTDPLMRVADDPLPLNTALDVVRDMLHRAGRSPRRTPTRLPLRLTGGVRPGAGHRWGTGAVGRPGPVRQPDEGLTCLLTILVREAAELPVRRVAERRATSYGQFVQPHGGE